MNDVLAQELTDWDGYYTVVGGMAATLIGLLFVAVSLRLDIFRTQGLADVRRFATCIFCAFLVVIVIAALALAPHPGRNSVVVILTFASLVALILIGRWGYAWIQVNLRQGTASPRKVLGTQPPWQGAATLALLIAPYVGILGTVWLVATRHALALGALAVSAGALLVLGTIAAWIMVSLAGAATENDA
jgi:hypothetical protein